MTHKSKGAARARETLARHGFEPLDSAGPPAPPPELMRFWARTIVPETAARGTIAGKPVRARVLLGLGTRSAGRVLVVTVASAAQGVASLRTSPWLGLVRSIGDLPAPLHYFLTILPWPAHGSSCCPGSRSTPGWAGGGFGGRGSGVSPRRRSPAASRAGSTCGAGRGTRWNGRSRTRSSRRSPTRGTGGSSRPRPASCPSSSASPRSAPGRWIASSPTSCPDSSLPRGDPGRPGSDPRRGAGDEFPRRPDPAVAARPRDRSFARFPFHSVARDRPGC